MLKRFIFRSKLCDKEIPLPKTSGIYGILCTVNNCLYIGSAIDLRNRLYTHRRYLIENKHHSRYLQRAFNKHGADCFEFYIIEETSKENLILKEQEYIDAYDPVFNMSKVAGSCLGVKRTDATREKIRAVMLGRKLTPAVRAVAIKNLKRQRKGEFKHSEATKEKMSATRQKVHPRGMLGKKHKPEAITRIKEGLSKRFVFLSPANKKKIIKNLADFCRKNNLYQSHMYAVHNGNRKSHQGWRKYFHTADELARVRKLLDEEVKDNGN